MSKDKVVSLRVTDAEHQALEAWADRLGSSLSDAIRRLALNAARPLEPLTPPSGSVTATAPANVIWHIQQFDGGSAWTG